MYPFSFASLFYVIDIYFITFFLPPNYVNAERDVVYSISSHLSDTPVSRLFSQTKIDMDRNKTWAARDKTGTARYKKGQGPSISPQ